MSIFKYMSENRIENILIDNKIRFTQPIYFNDPFEVKLAMKGFDTDEKLIKNFDMNFMKIIQEEYEKLDFEIKYKISFETFLFFANSRKEERKTDKSNSLSAKFMEDENRRYSRFRSCRS